MRLRSSLAVLGLTLLSSACYHQIVRTGRSPGSTVIDLPWTNTFLWGLVPAKEITTAAQCPGGVAVVETQMSFLNGLVGAITFGLYTPVTVTITCAGGSAAIPGARRIDVASDASVEERAAAVSQAIDSAVHGGGTVVVHF